MRACDRAKFRVVTSLATARMAAPPRPMLAPNPWFRPHFRVPRGLFGGLLATALAFPAAGQSRSDQVLFLDARGQPRTIRGVIQENSLSRVVVAADGRERNVDSGAMQHVEFGDVPPSFDDGVAYFHRSDFEGAARQFQLAATDASARAIVQAAARLRAAQAWIRRGAGDPNAFGLAREEAERFLADHPDDREVPMARALLGRATWLAGDPAAAAEIYRALYQEAQGGDPPTGYTYLDCYAGGLAAARAFLVTGDADAARGLFAELSTGLATVLASVEDGDPSRRALDDVHTAARLGEGYCLLAAGSTSQARTFFQRQLGDARVTDAQRFGAQLGLAEALLAEGDARRAQIEFASVSAIDHTDRDRVARALVGLAECAVRLSDADSRQDAKLWLQTVRDQFGDTPSVLRAQELSQTL